jgi:transcriptional regulator with XRE-family HTH domain
MKTDPFRTGDKLRKLREDHNYTQEYVAEMLGVAPSTLSDYEHGKVRVNMEALEKAAKLFNVDMTLFFSTEPLTFNVHDNHVARDMVQYQNNDNKEFMERMWSHLEERSKRFEELYSKTLDLFERLAKK